MQTLVYACAVTMGLTEMIDRDRGDCLDHGTSHDLRQKSIYEPLHREAVSLLQQYMDMEAMTLGVL